MYYTYNTIYNAYYWQEKHESVEFSESDKFSLSAVHGSQWL